jgi:hypothetical protein
VRTREQALAAQDPVVLTPVVLDAFTAAGVPLDPAEREALAGMLAVYVGDLALQEQFETDDGVDLAGLLGETASVRALSDAQVAALERVSDRLGSAALVTPLA